MNCAAACRWIDALLDGELDPKNDGEVREHLEGCSACRQRYEVKQAMSANMRRLELGYTAPESLRTRIAAALEAEAVAVAEQPAAAATGPGAYALNLVGSATQGALSAPPRASRRRGHWLTLAGWPVALAASALLGTVLLQQRSQVENDIVAAHVRSLLVDHLNDVASSSHHTVKPWFAGKIDFSPPVPDLSSLGFELVGGRLDYVEQQPAAAVVYRKHGHIINVLASRNGANLPRTARVQGYSLRSWKQSGLSFVAVSDIDPLELANLEHGYEIPPRPGAEPTGNP